MVISLWIINSILIILINTTDFKLQSKLRTFLLIFYKKFGGDKIVLILQLYIP